MRSGEYRESFHITRSVNLKGIDNPVIYAKKGNIINVKGSDVVIEGFTFKYGEEKPGRTDAAIFIEKGANNVKVRDNRFINIMFGIWNVESNNIEIKNNLIKGRKELGTNERGNCINLTGTKNAYIDGNRLEHCRDGVYMEICHNSKVIGNEIKNSRYSVHTMWVDRGMFNKNYTYENLVGMAIMYTKYSEIKDNISVGNNTHGLLLIQTVRSKVINNIVIGNSKGIFFYNSIYNKVFDNLIMNNNLGMHSWGGSEDNEIGRNSFINNEVQVKYVAGKDQEWNDNYWSDYVGWDMTNDGVGDYAYKSNSVIDHIFWRYPIAKVLYASPSLHFLWLIEKQFPLISVPKVVDRRPAMLPIHDNWKELIVKYPYTPKRYYGEVKKLQHVPGG